MLLFLYKFYPLICYNSFGDNMEIIPLSKNSEIIKELSKNIKNNKNQYCTIVDDLFVLELIKKHDISTETFIFCNDYDYRAESLQIIDFFKKTTTCYTVSTKVMQSLMQKENCCFMIAITKLNIHELTNMKDKDFLIICDGLEIPGNLGTIFRTADACGASGIILVDSVTKLNNPKLVHSSRGMNLLANTAVSGFQETIQFLTENNYKIFIGEPYLGTSYDECNYDDKIAIVIGSERYGCNKKWLNYDVIRTFIPMIGEMTSLNVSIAASIIMYKAYEKRK